MSAPKGGSAAGETAGTGAGSGRSRQSPVPVSLTESGNGSSRQVLTHGVLECLFTLQEETVVAFPLFTAFPAQGGNRHVLFCGSFLECFLEFLVGEHGLAVEHEA